jgi:hypothetical protein
MTLNFVSQLGSDDNFPESNSSAKALGSAESANF